MKLNYADIAFGQDGRVEVPELMLQTLAGESIGIIPGVSQLEMHIKFSEPSEMHFDVPATLGDVPNPVYERVTGHKRILTKHYGVYVTMNPTTEGDGISLVKHVMAYSLEKTLSNKRFFIEEGTFNFWNPALPDGTLLHRVLEKAPGWRIGYVSPSLYNKYRTFDQTDSDLLEFVYNTAAQTYQYCAVFDTYHQIMNFYDANAEIDPLQIFLDYDNLIDKLQTDEKSEELVTAMRPQGSDGLSIQEVNPTGSPWIYDLTNFISGGDLPATLVAKWTAWENKVASQREYYIALISLRASTTARLLAEKAKLVDLDGELSVLQQQRSAIVGAIGLASGAEKTQREDDLAAKNEEIHAKETEISAQQTLIQSLNALIDPSNHSSYTYLINEIVDELSITNTENFTEEEQSILEAYFIEADLQDESFVSSEIDAEVSGHTYPISGTTKIMLSNMDVTETEIEEPSSKTVYSMYDGSFAVIGVYGASHQAFSLEAQGRVATMDLASGSADRSFLLSLQGGDGKAQDGSQAVNRYDDLLITTNGSYSSLTDLTERMLAIYSKAEEYNALTNGNLDYRRRPLVPSSVMREKYPDFPDGDYATTYSFGETIGTYDRFSISITPIKDDGTVLDSNELGSYIDKLDTSNGIEGVLASDADNLIIQIVEGEWNASYWAAFEASLDPIQQDHLGLILNLQTETGLTWHELAGCIGDADQLHNHKWMMLATSDASMYVTAAMNEFQKYAVQRELYNFAVKELHKLATYTYELKVDAANFLFARGFDAFRNSLELGKAIYINMDGEKIKAPLIELAFYFDDESKLDLIFSNRIKRHDPVNTLKYMIESSYSSSRSVEAGKYLQGLVNDQASEVSRFMNSALDAAKNRVLGAANQSVTIDGAGIHVGETTGAYANYKLGIVNNMIAMTDDNWQHSKLAIGLFATPSGGTAFGVNAEYVAGKMLVGNSMVLESSTQDNDVALFKFDGSGASLHNADLTLYDAGAHGAYGRIDIGGAYGIIGGLINGVESIYEYNADGRIIGIRTTSVSDSAQHGYAATLSDVSSGYRPNANFWIDMNGDVYLSGKIIAKSGEIGGFEIKDSFLHGGSGANYVALNGAAYNATYNPNGNYAIWAGASSPASANFWVKKDGTVYGKSAAFKNSTFTDGEIVGTAIYVPDKTNPKFHVDSDGNLTLVGGCISWNNLTTSARNIINSYANPDYIEATYIDEVEIRSPTIQAGNFYGAKYHDKKDANGNAHSTLDITSSQYHSRMFFGPLGCTYDTSSFCIDDYDNGTDQSATLRFAGADILTKPYATDSVTAINRWDFQKLGAVRLLDDISYGTLTRRNTISSNWRTSAAKAANVGYVFFVI